MAPQQARVSADGFADGISQDVVVDTDIGEQARHPPQKLELASGAAIEKVLKPEDLACADQVCLGNSLRGLQPAQAFEGGVAPELCR